MLLNTIRHSSTITVLDFESSQENGKLDFFFPFPLYNPILHWTQCTHDVCEAKGEIDQVLYLCPYNNMEEVQKFKNALRSLSPNAGGIVVFKDNDSKGPEYPPWYKNDPPLYLVGKEGGQKLLELSTAQVVPVQPPAVLQVPPTGSRLPMARILPVFGGILQSITL